MTRIVLVAVDARLERRVQAVVADDMIVIGATDPAAFADRMSRVLPRAELVVFGHQLSRQLALALASAARQHADSMVIVSDEPDLLLEAMRSGVSEVIPTDIDSEGIDALLARAHQFSRDVAAAGLGMRVSRPTPGRVIAVASPKGGVGKTTIACNVALGLAQKYPSSVVLVDLDLQFGDVASTLNLEPVYFLETLVAKGAARDSLVLRTQLTQHPAGFAVVPAPESPAIADAITPAQIGHLIHQLSEEFRFVVVDTSPGLTEHTLTVLEQSTDVVAVTSMDVSSVRGMRKELEILTELGLLPDSRQTVVNFADRSSGLTVSDIETAIVARVDIVLPRTRAVGLATNRGIPVLVDGPRDRVSRNLRLLVGRLLASGGTRRSWQSASRKEKVS